MLSFAAFTPHTPLLIPGVSKEPLERLRASSEAMARLAEDAYLARLDTLVILSSHATQFDCAFSMNLHDEFLADLSAFGDLSRPKAFKPDLALMDALQRALRRGGTPLAVNSCQALDHGTSVPLLLLSERLPGVRVVPVSYAGLGPKDHLAAGRAIKEVIMRSPKRIGIVASGDLSHCLTSDAPAGYRREGAVFDELIRQAVQDGSSAKLLAASPELIAAASECAYRQLLMLFGVLDRVQVRPEVLSYESPFGVGYLVAEFHLG